MWYIEVQDSFFAEVMATSPGKSGASFEHSFCNFFRRIFDTIPFDKSRSLLVELTKTSAYFIIKSHIYIMLNYIKDLDKKNAVVAIINSTSKLIRAKKYI